MKGEKKQKAPTLVKSNSGTGRAEVSAKGWLQTKAKVRRDPRGGPNTHVAPPMLYSYRHALPPPHRPPLCARAHTHTPPTHQAAATLSHPIKLVLPVYLHLKRKYFLNSNVP